MSCLATLGNDLVQLVILLAIIAIIRIVIAAIGGAPWYPSWPVGGQPGDPAAGLGRVLGVLLAILDVIFWAAIVISLIWIVVHLVGCLGGVSMPRPFR